MNATELPDDLIGLDAAARLTGAHRATVFRWVDRGLVRGWRRLGASGRRHVAVSRAEVLAFAAPVPVVPRKAPPAVGPAAEARRRKQIDAYLDAEGL